MGIPQVLMIVIYGLSVLLCIYKAGKTKSFNMAIASFIEVVIIFVLLIWGGFFNG